MKSKLSKKLIAAVLAFGAANLASCEKNEAKPYLAGIPKIEVLTGEAFVHLQEFKVRIDPDTKAGFNAYNLPKTIFIECIGVCTYKVNGTFYNGSKLIQL